MSHRYEEWPSSYAWAKRMMKPFPYADWLPFYAHGLEQAGLELALRNRGLLIPSPVPFDGVPHQLGNELLWFDAGKPYFVVHPELLEVFARCRMDLPCGAIRFPFGLHSFHLRLPQPTTYRLNDRYYVKSILCNLNSDASWARMVELVPPLYKPNVSIRRQLTLWIDINEYEDDTDPRMPHTPVFTYRRLEWQSDTDTVEQALSKLPICPTNGPQLPEDVIRECIRTALSVCFLAEDDDAIVVPDVLKEDEFKFWATEDAQVKHELHQRARWKGKYGWLVGTDAMFDDRAAGPSHPRTGSAREYERLQYAHIRTGHWHLVWAGTQRDIPRVKWFRQTVVGKGLPFRRKEDS